MEFSKQNLIIACGSKLIKFCHTRFMRKYFYFTIVQMGRIQIDFNTLKEY